MNNKKGGFGVKFLLVLLLMIASAAGGAYGYSVLDGKMAARDALKAVENVDVSDYDTAEQTIIQGYIDDAKKDLETAKTRKEVYEVISDFAKNVSKVQTKAEKELEAALKAAEEAKQQQQQQQSYDDQTDTSQGNGTTDSGTTDNGGYKSNDLDTGADEQEDDGSGLLNSLFGGMAGGSGSN